MEPVTMVVAAMAAGVSAGLTETTSGAIVDAYRYLRDALRHRSETQNWDPDALSAYEADPQANEQRLIRLVEATDSGQDDVVLAAAARVLRLAEPGGTVTGKYVVDLRGAQGVIAGDRGIQHNNFGLPG
ncbi:hypothetical protein AB0B85_01650 [Micromonospora sp. NPDC049044]|uniref:hypothetical protein n=1 Tax=unclassified Micromonospora TaxID=2617518 RepID=UPI0033C60C8D